MTAVTYRELVAIPIQRQIHVLMAGTLVVFLLMAFRYESADRHLAETAYQLCLDRQRQAQEVNETRKNVGYLIIAMVPDAPQEAKDAMLAGMTSTQKVSIEDCDRWR